MVKNKMGITKSDNNPDTTGENMDRYFFRAAAEDFKKIPGSPIAYWVSERVRHIFEHGIPFGEIAKPKLGMRTGNNVRFIRLWAEVNYEKIGFCFSNAYEARNSALKWFPYNKGGEFRRWYGNNEYLVNWENDGYEIKVETLKNYPQLSWENLGWKISNEKDFFKPSLEWSRISSEYLGVRFSQGGFLFDTNGSSAFPEKNCLKFLLAFLCTKISANFAKIVNPSLAFQPGDLSVLPVVGIPELINDIDSICAKLIDISKVDWDSYEISWDFSGLPLLRTDYCQPILKATYQKLGALWQKTTMEMQQLEEENNRIFIEAYGLQDELTPDVPLHEITLTCNPHYRYGKGKTDEEYETLQRTDTIKELISYAVGCMMGRYSLDHPGLIYAHSGNIDFDPSKYKTFPADDDGILPIMDMDWFEDDATPRFVEFIKTAWPPETLSENLKFIADSLNTKSGESSEHTIRRYLSTNFFKDHMQTYKKRSIYWLFSSGKQKAFECLVYLHRCNDATLSRMRSNYVTPLQGNISARIEFLEHEKDAATTASSQKKIQKEIDTLKKKQVELKAFDDELRHYADMRITLDLDDGVKVNCGRFGKLLAFSG